MAIIFLGLGSNLGDRKKNIARAVDLLSAKGISVLRCSTLIETDPVGGPPGQGRFLNGVLKAETDLSPEELLQCLKEIERQLGRTKTVRNGPRIIDLDILLYDNLTLNTPGLALPHPRMLERSFVMAPLSEIDPRTAENISHAHL
ncbi:MAG: 2-amino-4-hydroxy-6-hydroxymethyldihydropteridine diphosphokinase [Omnitrophica WOR_2 bacterium RIFCSPHIGHO2_02_FULL_52_10]|nr:MAG: 2-amino-4-hydroxy-6-hydroxymethyldihydropteridine diphosphokinase [Omnitrophica WOR_2 bacterium RIFCSPHIGHO2_02_FULL_52_10]